MGTKPKEEEPIWKQRGQVAEVRYELVQCPCGAWKPFFPPSGAAWDAIGGWTCDTCAGPRRAAADEAARRQGAKFHTPLVLKPKPRG